MVSRLIRAAATLLLLCVTAFGLTGTACGAPPEGWFVAGSHPQDYEVGVDRTVAHGGKASGYLKSRPSQTQGFGTLMQMYQAAAYRGKRLRLSGYVRTRDVGDWAGMWMRVDGKNTVLSFDNMQNRPIKRSTDWKKYEIVLDVPDNSTNVAFGILLSGKGQAWIDDLQFEVVGKDVPTTNLEQAESQATREYPRQPANLNFEQ